MQQQFEAVMQQDSKSTSDPDRSELVQKLADLVLSGQGLSVFFDNDGTVCPFVADPKDAKIDPDCYRALVRLGQMSGVTTTSLTGREVHEARDLMLTPGLEVRDSGGALLARGGQKRLFFRIVGSHGVECLAPDGEDGASGAVTRYDFPAPAQAFIEQFQETALAFKEKHPSLTVEIKHGAVGVNTATIEGIDDAQRAEILSGIRAALDALLDGPSAPTAENGQKIFALRQEGDRELEVRPALYGKDFGIRTFGNPEPGKPVIFLCDSLGDQGTDRPAATLVNTLENGMVFMVLNGRNTPPAPDCPHAPCAVFDSPADLGQFLIRVAEKIEKALAPAPAQSLPLPKP